MRIGNHQNHQPAGRRDILLDRDGTLIEDRSYLSNPDGVTPLPGAAEALRRLVLARRRIFVVSNQSGIGRGYFRLEDTNLCNRRLEDLFAAWNVHFTDIIFCPHAPQDDCACRKPRAGMWETLRERHGLRAEQTAMIGDKGDDVLFGRGAGLFSILVLTGKGRAEAARFGWPAPGTGSLCLNVPGTGEPHAVAADLAAAVELLLSRT